VTSRQYEEFCRLFLACELGCPIEQIVSADLENPAPKGQPPLIHQIDLHWRVEDPLAKFVLIANAKWREGNHEVGQGAVLLIQKVREKLAAHKAVLLTNTGFTEGARAAAPQEGVALHIVRPLLDQVRLHASDATVIRGQLQALARRAGPRPLYAHQVVHKGLGLTLAGDAPVAETAAPAAAAQAASQPVPSSGSAPQGYLTKTLTGGSQAPSSSGSGPAPVPRRGPRFTIHFK
jgi:hypothetical protein